jgi:Xaa-Pro aminopeptidase
VPRELLDPAPVLHELRLFKDEGELERMRRAAAITAEAHAAVLAAARPGAHEYELDALLEYTFRRRGGSGAAYTPIVAGGANACVLHYVENDDVLRDGDLLLVDAGAEFENYACDVTRTFPVGEAFSAEQRALYEVCLAAQVDAIDAVRAGAPYDAPHTAAVRRLAEGLVDLGLLKGPPDEAARNGALHRFFPHRTSHWLGLDVHDCGATGRAGEPRPLEPGMVLTVEPGLYVAPDDEEVDAPWRGLGIRIEDDVVVTSGDPEVLTAAIPKGVADLEGRRGPPDGPPGRPAVPRGAAGAESAGRGKEDRPPAKG